MVKLAKVKYIVPCLATVAISCYQAQGRLIIRK